VPWAVTAVFLVLAFGAIAWWSFRPPRQPVPTAPGVESMGVDRQLIRPPFETGGAFHATGQSGAGRATPVPPDTTRAAPPAAPSAAEPEPAPAAEEPIANPPDFEGDAELQRQFEAELRRVEELLAASPLNGNNGDSVAAQAEEPVAEPEPEAEQSPQQRTAPDTPYDSPPVTVADTAALEPVVERSADTASVAAPATDGESQPVPATIAVPASIPPPKSPAASDIATPASSTVLARSGVAKIQTGQDMTVPPDPEPRPTVKLGDLVEPGPGVVPPAPLEIVRPQYPPLARRLGVQGTVRMSVLVDEEGRVTETRLLEGVPRKVGINEAALAAAAKARFSPAIKDGTRVKMWYEMVSRFEQ
jgi:protein TonB